MFVFSLQGFSVVWEPRVGYALIGLTLADMECLTLPLDEKKWSLSFSFFFLLLVHTFRFLAPKKPLPQLHMGTLFDLRSGL